MGEKRRNLATIVVLGLIIILSSIFSGIGDRARAKEMGPSLGSCEDKDIRYAGHVPHPPDLAPGHATQSR
jgi:hypothetical protein